MQTKFKVRYEGTRWEIGFGTYEGIEKVAVNELQREVQRHLPYVVATRPAEAVEQGTHRILVGTGESNAAVGNWLERGAVEMWTKPGSYAIYAGDDPEHEGCKLLVLAGQDPKGVLNAVMDWAGRYNALAHPFFDRPRERREAFDGMPEMDTCEAAAVDRRGIWTWGYVIYDYRKYLDAMARLRFNVLTVWNDCPPVNFAEVVDYAHARGIEIVAGFHWGWGFNTLDLAKPDDRAEVRRDVLERYRRDYRHYDLDGIYFQTLTEHTQQTMSDGRTTAAVCTDLVNEIATEILELDPDLRIEWGLHATSVTQHVDDLKALRPEVILTWEDAGAMPWAYDPHVHLPETFGKRPFASFEETLEFSRQLVRLRPGTEFAMVPKGWCSLDWAHEFENHDPFVLGERDPEWIARRAAERQTRWGWVDRLWQRDFGYAAEFYRRMLEEGPPAPMTATALVEDGVIEAGVPLSLRLFAETVWNPERPDSEILDAALSPWWAR